MDILILYLEAEFLHDIAADKLPAEVPEEAVELLIDLLLGKFAFIDIGEPPLEESLRKLNVSLVKEILAGIERETVIGILLVVGLYLLLNAGISSALLTASFPKSLS